ELRPVPLVPTALERIDFRKTLVNQLLCRPGTGILIRSSTVENEGCIFVILSRYISNLGGVNAHRSLDFLLTGLPVLPLSYVYNDHIGTVELGPELFLGHFFDGALDHRRLEQEAYEREAHHDGEPHEPWSYRHIVSPLPAVGFPVETAPLPVDTAARHGGQPRRQPSQARLRTLALALAHTINTTRCSASWL